MSKNFDIVLASSSPRRKELLASAGLNFRVHAVSVDETLEPELVSQPLEAVKKLAERKAHAAIESLLVPEYVGDMALIAADTMVVLGNTIFGKPRDASEAFRMLSELSGKTHFVHTAVSLWLIHAGNGEDIGLGFRTFVDTSSVSFKELSSNEIRDYIDTGDAFDKAGAYGIQGMAKRFVSSLQGELDTVIGLPVSRMKKEFPDLFGHM